MKKLFLIAAVGAACAFSAHAILAPFYKTQAAVGNAAKPAEVDFISSPGMQVRLVSVNYQSDTNNAQLQISSASTAFSVAFTNIATTDTTNVINITNGLPASGTLLLEHGGAAYVASFTSSGNTGTNTLTIGGVTFTNQTTTTGINTGAVGSPATNLFYVVTAAGGFGVATSVGDSVYLMGTASAIPIGASTNWINGEAIYIGTVGRPLRVLLTPTLVTNQLPSVTAHYE